MQVMMFPASFQATRVSRNRFLCSSQTMFVLLRLAARLSDRATRKVRQEDPQVRSTRAGHRRRRIAAAAIATNVWVPAEQHASPAHDDGG
jgi:hypothetical protein